MLLRLGGLSAGVRASPAAKLRHLATPLEKNRLDFEAHQLFCFLSPVLEDHQKFSSFFCPPTSPHLTSRPLPRQNLDFQSLHLCSELTNYLEKQYMHSVSPPPYGPTLSYPVFIVLAALGERFKLVCPNFMLRILFCHLPSLTVTLVINIIYIFHKNWEKEVSPQLPLFLSTLGNHYHFFSMFPSDLFSGGSLSSSDTYTTP